MNIFLKWCEDKFERESNASVFFLLLRFYVILQFVNQIIRKNLMFIQFNVFCHLIYLISRFLRIYIFG